MAGVVSEDFVAGRSLEGLSSGSRCQSGGDALSEWRSSEQVENGITSTSPPYWDTDDSDDDDGGLKPSELYGKHTWKIEKFSQINKRELRSDAFEVGGYKWYILIYPQGCDVCNHLSLFLCVANHDKLLPGWSHFAQFTIAVVNKDPKKSKYSDTLHRFWKKEHDWGWKKFMELSKVSDGFVEADTLVIRAQVQVIREKADRPFRCLDCQYRRELVRVYLTNVEQICRRFVEERRGKLGKLIEDKTRWSSFCAFWLGMDQDSKRRMSKEKKDMILKVIVKHFFIEKEVTSTLVMDSLYSGLNALEGQSKSKKGKGKLLNEEDTPAPIVQLEKDMFVLVDDVLLLLERAAMEPLPPKDDKGPQNRTKDGSIGEDFTRDSIERDERRLTELGRRTVEIFALAHIFSTKIEVAYQEAVALKRQEELIREEEAAWLAESEQKAKRGVDKDKKSKKKQGKQKRNNRKGKDKAKDEKPALTIQDKQLYENLVVEGRDELESHTMPEKDDTHADVSDVSDSECAADMLQHDSEERDASPVNWDTDTSEIHHRAEASGSEVSTTLVVQNGVADKRNSSFLDDSSSTCSTDSAPSVAMNGSFRSNSFASFKPQKSPTRGKVQRGKMVDEDYGCPNVAESRPCEAADVGFQNNATSRHKAIESDYSEEAVASLQDRTKWPELSSAKKEEDEVVLTQRRPNNKDNLNPGTSQEKVGQSPNFPKSPPRSTSSSTPNPLSALNPKSDLKSIHHTEQVPASRKPSFNGRQGDKATTPANLSQAATLLKPDSSKASLGPTERVSGQQTTGLSRPSSAPIIPGTVSVSPVVSMIQTTAPKTAPLSRSVSATGRLGPDPLALGQAYVPQSYRNAIVGNSLNMSTSGFTQFLQQTSAMVTNAPTFSQQASVAPAQMYHHQTSERMEPNNNQPWMENLMMENRDALNFDSYRLPLNRGSHELFLPELSVGTSGRQGQGALADEFPHLDIINDLLDDEQGLGRAARASPSFQPRGGGGPALYSRHFTYPTDMSLSSEPGSSGASCRLDRSRSYPDGGGFPQVYGTGSHYDGVGEFMAQGNSMPYVNGQIDGMVPNQWQVMGPDLSLLGMGSGIEGYPYGISDYSNMACGVNGYAMFPPSNGH